MLSIDYGTKRIGLATCDELELTVTRKGTLTSQGIKRDAHRLSALADQLEAKRIIVGLPLNMSGSVSLAAKQVMKLAEQLRKLTHVPVLTWDERLTSWEAQQRLTQRQIKPARQKGLQDQVAACLILEDYLTQHRTRE